MGRMLLAAVPLCLVTVASADPGGPAPIIGGTNTLVGEYPTVVALRVGTSLCTGTLIHRDWVLTAAHCLLPQLVQLPDQQAVTQNIRIHFGTVDLNMSAGEVRTASATFPKPGFMESTIGSDDIGLIRLAQPFTGIEPTPVNLDPARAPIGTSATMVGYGATLPSGGQLGVQFKLENRASISCAPYQLSNTNLLCFSQTDNKGKCRGDSGGPTFAQVDGKRTVVGVTSFGDATCEAFGADTRTDVEQEFIESTMASLIGCERDEECAGKTCFLGRCVAPPFDERGLGHTCETSADCDTGTCGTGPGGRRCTAICKPFGNICPEDFECIAAAGATGACWPEDRGGCCDASNRSAPTALLGIALVGLALRRRRG